MPPRQKLLAIAIAAGVLVLIVELVRKRRLREEYATLWILTGLTLLVLALRFDLLQRLTRLLGIALPASTLFLLALLFLMLLGLQFSVKISALTSQVQQLAQEIALRGIRHPGGAPGSPAAEGEERDRTIR